MKLDCDLADLSVARWVDVSFHDKEVRVIWHRNEPEPQYNDA